MLNQVLHYPEVMLISAIRVISGYLSMWLVPDYSRTDSARWLRLSKPLRDFNPSSQWRFYLKTKKLHINSNFDKSLDYFEIRGCVDPYISEDLKETFEIAGITGVKIIEASNPELVFD